MAMTCDAAKRARLQPLRSPTLHTNANLLSGVIARDLLSGAYASETPDVG